jgi:hypothetical protein
MTGAADFSLCRICCLFPREFRMQPVHIEQAIYVQATDTKVRSTCKKNNFELAALSENPAPPENTLGRLH